jgi:predicted sugar kinase
MSTTQKVLTHCSVTVDESTNLTVIEQSLVALAGTNVAAGAVGNVSVGSSTTVVLAAGVKRERVVLTNDSDEKIYIAVGAAAESAKGIPLAANGGAVILTPSGGCKLAINAICASGGKTLAYQTLSTS